MGQTVISSDFPGFSGWGDFVFSKGKLRSQHKKSKLRVKSMETSMKHLSMGRLLVGSFQAFLAAPRRTAEPRGPVSCEELSTGWELSRGRMGGPILIRCRYWEEFCSLYEVPRPQPSTG